MSRSEEDLASLVAELVRSLQELQRELEPGGRRRGPPRPPTPGELAEFTSEVAIPGLVLLLETNIRALRLLQRALRLAADRDTESRGPREQRLAERAAAASGETLSRLDDVLAELQNAVEGRPTDDEARQLLAEARRLRAEVQQRLDDRVRDAEGEPRAVTESEEDSAMAEGDQNDDGDHVEVDVEAELDAIRDELDGTTGRDDDARPENGTAEDRSETDDQSENGTAGDRPDGSGT
jgi:hypothetical protein